MYRRPKFLEILDEIREEMSREADYDVDLFAEMVRNNQSNPPKTKNKTDDFFSLGSIFFENHSKTKK